MRSHSERERQGLWTVTLARGRSGYGFTISGQNPCCLGGLVKGSSAERVGLRVGDQVICIDGHDVSNATHDDVVRLIGMSRGLLTLDIAERSSDYSSEEDLDSSDNDCDYVGRSDRNEMQRMRPITVRECSASPVCQKSSSKYARYTGHSHTGHLFGPLQTTKEKCLHSGLKASNIQSYKSERNHLNSKGRDCETACRPVKHTIITREDRLGYDRPPSGSRHLHSPAENHMLNYQDESLSAGLDDFQVIVTYSGSVEMPSDAPRLVGSRLQSIRAAVQRIRATRCSRSLVLMDIDVDGIRLVDTSRHHVATYVTERIAFCGICPDDQRFFGIVMSPADKENCNGSSCHVFMVDPDLSEHRMHAGTASRFGINCTMDLDTDCCLEFPTSATPIIDFLGGIYRQRKSVGGFFAPVSNVLNETKCNNGSAGVARNSKPHVVDVANLKTSSLEQSFIHDLSAIRPAVHEKEDHDCENYHGSHHFSEIGRKKALSKTHSTAASLKPSMRERLNPRAMENRIALASDYTALDDVNSADNLRRSLHKFFAADRQQWLPKLTPSCDELESCDAIETCARPNAIESSHMPPPPLPPRQVYFNSDLSGKGRNTKPQSLTKVTPVMVHKAAIVNATSERKSELVGSTSKPPLPKRKPIRMRSEHEFSSQGPIREAANWPKSTPAVEFSKQFSVAVPEEMIIYDSDPGEQSHDARNMRSSKPEYDSASNSEGSSKVGVFAVSCKTLTKIGTENPIGRAASWAVHFDRLLSDAEGVATFSEFLQKEFSQENLSFCLKCEEYKKLANVEQRKLAAIEIFNKHFKDSCSEQVNVDGVVREAVVHNMASAGLDLFDAAHKQIYLLMKHDSYPRFLKSEIYKQAVIAEMEGKSFPCSRSSVDDQKGVSTSGHKKSKPATYGNGSEEKRRRSLLPWSRNKQKQVSNSNLALLVEPNREQHRDCTSKSLDVISSKITDQSEFSVALPGGLKCTLFAGPGQTIYDMLSPLTDKLQQSLDFFDVILPGSEKSVSMSCEAVSLKENKEIHLDRCAVFRLDILVQRHTMAVRARYQRPLNSVLEPVLVKYGFQIKDVVIHTDPSDGFLTADSTAGSVDGKHVLVNTLDELKGKKKKDGRQHSSSKQKSIASLPAPSTIAQQLKILFGGSVEGKNCFNDVIFDEFGVWVPDKVKSDDARHSGLFSFMRRSSVGEKKNGATTLANTQMPTATQAAVVSVAPGPLSHRSTDENKMFDMLKRVQNRQYDDQRGTSLTAFKEMPDFLKESADAVLCEETFCKRIADEIETQRLSEVEVGRDEANDDTLHEVSFSPPGSLQTTHTFNEDLDSILPSNENAELYFFNSIRVSSPDFNDSGLMECSLRDIGIESPTRSTVSSDLSRRRGGWTLTGSIAAVQPLTKADCTSKDVDISSVPSSCGQLSLPNLHSNSVETQAAMAGHHLGGLDSDDTRCSSSDSSMPATHELVFINGECIKSKLVPYADEDGQLSEDGDQVYGVV